MSGREDDITAPPLSQDTPPHPWTPPAQFGPEASWSGVVIETVDSGSRPSSQAARPRMGKRPGHRHGSPVLGPLLLIAAGVVFLLNNMEIVPWAIWGELWRLWPLVLVAIGLDMLVGRRNPALSVAIVVGVLAAGVWFLYATGSFGPANLMRLPMNFPLGNAKDAEVAINLDGADLSLGSLMSESRELVSGTLEYYDRRGEPRHEVIMNGQSATLQLDSPSSARNGFSMFAFGGGSPKWDVRLNRQIPLRLTLNMGDDNSTLDLQALRVATLYVGGDDGNLQITLPEKPENITGTIALDNGNIDIFVPTKAAARIQVEKDDGNVTTDSTFTREGDTDTYISKNIESAARMFLLNIQLDDGNVNIRSK